MNILLMILAALSLDSTHVHGRALTLAGGHGLAGVRVSLASATDTTDSTGAFALTVPAGVRRVFHFEWQGQTGSTTAEVDLGQALEVVLDTESNNLRPAVREDDWQLPGEWGMAGFFARRTRGYGQFFTLDDIRSAGVSSLRALLESQGVGRGCPGSRACGPVLIAQGQKHAIEIWVDGVIQTDEDADDLSLQDVAGVEYYPPPMYAQPASVSPDRKWILDTRYFLKEPLRGSMVIVWTRGFDGPKR